MDTSFPMKPLPVVIIIIYSLSMTHMLFICPTKPVLHVSFLNDNYVRGWTHDKVNRKHSTGNKLLKMKLSCRDMTSTLNVITKLTYDKQNDKVLLIICEPLRT